jgi:hypothetical protein
MRDWDWDGQTMSEPSRFGDNAPTILATEHWSLLGTRSLTYSEAFSRTTVFLNVLSASIVALALIADATGFDESFGAFALFVFPLVLLLGVATYVRLVQLNQEDVYLVVAMNRMRRAYMEMAPELEPYFTTGSHDDEQGVMRTLLLGQPTSLNRWQHFFITTPTVVATINSIVAASGVALLASRYGLSQPSLIAASLATFVGVWLLHFAMQLRTLKLLRQSAPRFPSPGRS